MYCRLHRRRRFVSPVSVPRLAKRWKPVKILAVETSLAQGSVALLDGERLVAEKTFGEGTRHGRDLLPCVDELLAGEPGSVDLLAIDAGPGSYTGLRVGFTFVKTFATQSHVPVVSVSSLDVIAANTTVPNGLCVVVDARLGQVFAALYDGEGKRVSEDIAAPPGDVAARLGPGSLVIGGGLKRYGGVFAEVAEVSEDESTWWPRAANVGRLGQAIFAEKGGEDPLTLAPRYLGRPQAELKWEQSQNASGPK